MTPLKTTCGCCTLRTGTIIIAVISMIYSVFAIFEPFITDMGVIDDPVTILNIIFRILQFISSVILLFGAIKERRALLLLWMVITTYEMVITVHGYFIFGIVIFRNKDVVGGLIYTGLALISGSVSIYSWLIVYSYKKELRGSTNVLVASPNVEYKV